MTEKTIGQILHELQKNLKAPKGQTNKFGGYKYRSCEDILEALKSVMPENAYVTISDDIITLGSQSFRRDFEGEVFGEDGVSQGIQKTSMTVGERFYVKATATLHYNGYFVSACAFAREPLEKKGSDASQITGAASSYARKYALNGLFLIDDTKDADATETHGKEKPEPQDDRTEKWTPEQRSLQAEVITRIAQCKDEVDIDSILDEYGQGIADLPESLMEVVTEQVNNSREFLKKGGKPDIKYHKFPSVAAAVQWMNKMYPVVNGFRSIKMMDVWEGENIPFINGLDCLKAETYKKNDKLPKERLLEALTAKRAELTNIDNANTPIG